MCEAGTDEFEGTVESIIYYDEDSHFAIVRFLPSDSLVPVVAKGSLIKVKVGETLRLNGTWIEDPRYGEQFRVGYFQVLTPQSIEGVKKYLGSGLIPGIGPVMAERLVGAFGAKTIDTIESQPQSLYQVPGIGKVRVQKILDSWRDQKQIRDVLIFLRGYGLSEALSMKVYRRFEEKTMEEIRVDPYRLVKEIEGVGFLTADRIAKNLGYGENSIPRCSAGIHYVLQEALQEGHCYLPGKELVKRSVKLLGVEEKLVLSALDTLLETEGIFEQEGRYLLPKIQRIEDRVALRLLTITKTELEQESIDQKELEELLPDIALSKEQINALSNGLKFKVSIITGGPGVGKTTVLATMVSLFKSRKREVILCSPTGKASRRMEETTNHKASTIHKLLKFQGNGFEYNEENPLEGDVFILDEVSMVDLFLFDAFLKAVPLEARVIFVGDVDQLPSVGPGFILRDMIQSTLIPVSYLTYIFRQSTHSEIVHAAHRVNAGQWFRSERSSDFFFVEQEHPKDVRRILGKMLQERIPARFGLHPVLDVQVLAPMYKGEAGIDHLNAYLQNLLNPHGEEIEHMSRIYREKDKVMQLVNNYEKEVFNGDQGIITWVNSQDSSLRVRFEEGREHLYTKKELEELTLSYVCSIHKVQGSEFPCVILVMMNSHYTLLKRSLLYTALTRGKKLAILVGQRKAYQMAIRDNGGRSRFTMLPDRLKTWHDWSRDPDVEEECAQGLEYP